MKDTRTHISRLHFATPEEQEKILDELDHLGFFMLPDENWSMFTERISLLQKVLGEIESGKIPPELRSHIQFREKISGDFTAEANRKLMEHYKFRNSWAPAFFSKEETGSFSAGVQLEVDETYPVIFLHDAFAEKNSHCGYDRTEILAHELIHAAKMFFPPSRYEEYFTCHIYKSPLRRWMGNLFRSKYLITPFLAGFFGGSVSVS
ncbi:MAG: hypothetical protein J6S58_07935, partial [Lentisphaeria bacterium]|nr:hypothetical protein [Lentisphaeria bacterium]